MKRILFFFFLSVSLFAQKPYVLLVSFDGFRWDYLNRGLTPNLNSIAEDGVHALTLRPVFPSKTFPNHLSIITGQYPENHGIIANYFENPNNGKIYRIGNNQEVKNPEWYNGEFFWETAEKNGIKTASFFWPGSEIALDYRSPSIYKEYNHKTPYTERIDTIKSWLQLPHNKRPHFITLYFHETDSRGHETGPDSPETNNAINLLDSLTGVLMKSIEETGLKDSVNIIFVSDHGMTEIWNEKIIRVDELTAQFGIKDFTGNGPVTMFDCENIDEVYAHLKKHEKHYSVYKKENLPEYYKYDDHPFIQDIIIIADLGWSLLTKAPNPNYSSKGTHGYDHNQLDMHGIFIATGPAFKSGYKTGSLWNIDIYPLMCEIFGIRPSNGIDGKLERIGFILK